jgi:hypothetical protein
MTPLAALLAMIALFTFGIVLIAKIEGLAFLAPGSTARLAGPAREFCHGACRTSEGNCPLTGSATQALQCPLWKFIEADARTTLYGSPFAERTT